jgi:hypothetical protein
VTKYLVIGLIVMSSSLAQTSALKAILLRSRSLIPVKACHRIFWRKAGLLKSSGLNGWPIRSPTDASPLRSRVPAHDSGSVRVADSFTVVDLHLLLLAGFTGAPKSLFQRKPSIVRSFFPEIIKSARSSPRHSVVPCNRSRRRAI